VAKS